MKTLITLSTKRHARWYLTLAFILCCMMATSLNLSASVHIDGLYYNLNATARTAEVTYFKLDSNSTYAKGDVVIPSTVQSNGVEYNVTSIGDWAFMSCYDLTSIKIPDGVTSIGEYAFVSCSKLKEASLPNSITSMGYAAFASCTALPPTLVLPSSLKTLGEQVYMGCTSLTSVTLPSSLTSISGEAFSGCTGLTSIILTSAVTEIRYNAFYNCSSLTTVVSPSNTPPTLGDYAFYNSGLKNVYAPSAALTAYKNAWGGAYTYTGLSDVTRTITWYDQNGAVKTTQQSLPLSIYTVPSSFTLGGVQYPVESAASGGKTYTVGARFLNTADINLYAYTQALIGGLNYNLSAATKTATVTYVKFDDDTYVSGAVTIPATVSNDGIDYKVTGISDWAFMRSTDLTSIRISEGITRIGEYAFLNCASLKNVYLPNSITSIGYAAFASCTNLSPSLVLPNSLKSLGEQAYMGCKSLTSVTVPSSLTAIPGEAFSGCTGLTSIVLTNSITEIQQAAFNNCTSLTTVISPSNTPPTLRDYAFNNSALKNVYAPSSALTAYKNAWGSSYTYTGLSEVSAAICWYNDPGDYRITNQVIPSGIYTVPSTYTAEGVNYAVQRAVVDGKEYAAGSRILISSKASSIYLYDYSTALIDGLYYCLYDAKRTASVTYLSSFGNRAYVKDALIIPSTVQRDDINYTVTEIGYRAFLLCGDLTSVTLPESVTTIGEWAFSLCSGLTSIILPKSVKTISSNAFSLCSFLKKIVSLSPTPPSLGEFAFNVTPMESVYAPADSLKAYQRVWGDKYTYIGLSDVTGIITNHLQYGVTGRTNLPIPSGIYTVPDSCFSDGMAFPVKYATCDGRTYAPGSRLASFQQPSYIDLYTYDATCTAKIRYMSASTGSELRTDSFTVPTGRSFPLPRTYRYDNPSAYAAEVMYISDFPAPADYYVPTSDFMTFAIVKEGTVATAHRCTVLYAFGSTTLATDTVLLPDKGAYAVPDTYTFAGCTYPVDSALFGAATYHPSDSIRPTTDCTLTLRLKPAVVTCTYTTFDTDRNFTTTADTAVVKGQPYPLPKIGQLLNISGEKYLISEVLLDDVKPSIASYTPFADFTLQVTLHKQKEVHGTLRYNSRGMFIKTDNITILEGRKIPIPDSVNIYATPYRVDNITTTKCATLGDSIVPTGNDFDIAVYVTYTGDADGDGTITKLDINQLIGVLLSPIGSSPIMTPQVPIIGGQLPILLSNNTIVERITDVNGDGKIDSRDLVGLVNVSHGTVWNHGSSSKAFQQTSGGESDAYGIPSLTLHNGETATLDIALTNPHKPCTAGMFDLVLPEWLTVTDAQLITTRATNHTLFWKALPDSAVRVVFYSPDNTLLTATSGPLLRLTVKVADAKTPSVASIALKNAQIASPDASALEPADIMADVRMLITGITDVTPSRPALTWRTRPGALTLTAPATETRVTVYTPTGAFVTSFVLQAGENRTLSLQPGIYLVNKMKIEVR